MTDDARDADDATPSTPVVHGPAALTDLEDWGPLAEATGPEMQTAGLIFWEDGNGNETGIWECSPGPSRWTLETHEFVQVLAGSMTVTPDGGDPVDLKAGDSVTFPKGWTGTWDITETLRKAYVIFGG
jgi:uncharacterized cupin superfamily protein